MDQSDVGFVLPGLWRSSPSPDFNAIHAANMTLCHAFLKRHLWKGIYTSNTVPYKVIIPDHLPQIPHGQSEILMRVTQIVQELYSMELM